MSWFVYILKCRNQNFYTGITNDLKKRIDLHRRGKGAAYTRSFGVIDLVYSEACATKSQALKREAEIKSWSRTKKMELIRLKKKRKTKV